MGEQPPFSQPLSCLIRFGSVKALAGRQPMVWVRTRWRNNDRTADKRIRAEKGIHAAIWETRAWLHGPSGRPLPRLHNTHLTHVLALQLRGGAVLGRQPKRGFPWRVYE